MTRPQQQQQHVRQPLQMQQQQKGLAEFVSPAYGAKKAYKEATSTASATTNTGRAIKAPKPITQQGGSSLGKSLLS